VLDGILGVEWDGYGGGWDSSCGVGLQRWYGTVMQWNRNGVGTELRMDTAWGDTVLGWEKVRVGQARNFLEEEWDRTQGYSWTGMQPS